MTYPHATFPNTQHSVFYAYSITVGGEPIGSFEKFGSNFTRTHERIREIYFPRGPQTKEIIWGGTDISVTVTQVELYDKAIFQAFGVQIYSIEDFNQVVDINEVMHKPENINSPQTAPTIDVTGEETSAFRTRVITYRDCVPTSVTKDIDTSSAKAVSMTFECRTVTGEEV